MVHAWTPCQTDVGSTLGATLFFITIHVVVTQSKRERAKEKERQMRKITDHRRERKKDRQQESTMDRERQKKSARRRHVATNITAATLPKPGVTSSRPAFEQKRGKEREKKKEREEKEGKDKSEFRNLREERKRESAKDRKGEKAKDTVKTERDGPGREMKERTSPPGNETQKERDTIIEGDLPPTGVPSPFVTRFDCPRGWIGVPGARNEPSSSSKRSISI